MSHVDRWMETLRECEGSGCRVLPLDPSRSGLELLSSDDLDTPAPVTAFGRAWLRHPDDPWAALASSSALVAEDAEQPAQAKALQALRAIVARATRAAIVWGGWVTPPDPDPWGYLLEIAPRQADDLPGYLRVHLPASSSTLAVAETLLAMELPPSFKRILQLSNGLGLDAIEVTSIAGAGAQRADWETVTNGDWLDCSGYREIAARWRVFQATYDYERRRDEQTGINTFASDARVLVPFMYTFFGDAWCFDRSRRRGDGEYPVVFWDHESRKAIDPFPDFASWLQARLDAELFSSD